MAYRRLDTQLRISIKEDETSSYKDHWKNSRPQNGFHQWVPLSNLNIFSSAITVGEYFAQSVAKNFSRSMTAAV